MVVDKGLFIKK